MRRSTGKYALAWLPLVMFTNVCGAAEHLADANYFGAFTTESRDGTTGCASLDSKGVTLGMPVNVVVLSRPQRLLRGKITSQSSAECTRYFQASESAAFYDIVISQGKFEPHELGVLVLPGASLAKTKTGDFTVELDQKHYRFFECSSTEGIHLGVRSMTGEAKTIWHDYIHLGIDVEPTCRKSDYAGIETLGKAFNRDARTRAR
jgi:hypothetical protein